MSWGRYEAQVVRADWAPLTARSLIAEEMADVEARRRYPPWALFWRLRQEQRRKLLEMARR